MTLSRVLASLTGRHTAAPPRMAGKDSSPVVTAAILQSDRLQFLPSTSGEHSLGPTREVRERITEILPGVTFDDDGRGSFTRTGYSIAFETGTADCVRSVSVRVSGGRAAAPPLTRLAAKTGWRLAVDAR
jgi:hypothetical protein